MGWLSFISLSLFMMCVPCFVAFSSIFSSFIALITAFAAAQATGFAPNVEAWLPGVQSCRSARDGHDAQREARGNGLGDCDDVGCDAEVLYSEPLSRPAHARLHLIDREEYAVFVE